MTENEGTARLPAGEAPSEDETAPAAVADPREQPVTSPTLDHLEETIKGAKQAADEALSPQRE